MQRFKILVVFTIGGWELDRQKSYVSKEEAEKN